MDNLVSVYETIGQEKLYEMIDVFYQYVEKDDRINFLFPGDWEDTAYKQKLFQTQFLGGPNLYNETFGHPMMRARHMPFKITEKSRDAWLDNMRKAMNDVGLD
ncbi:globin, partial [Haloferula chungangensis]